MKKEPVLPFFSVRFPASLHEKINRRAIASGHSVSAQCRVLINFASEALGDECDTSLVPASDEEGVVRTSVGLNERQRAWLDRRCFLYQRSGQIELLRVLGFAVAALAERDLALIRALLADSDARSPERNASAVVQPG
jgi:hypothetical protein